MLYGYFIIQYTVHMLYTMITARLLKIFIYIHVILFYSY